MLIIFHKFEGRILQLFNRIALKPDFSGPIKFLSAIYSKLSKGHLRIFAFHARVQTHKCSQGGPRGPDALLPNRNATNDKNETKSLISSISVSFSIFAYDSTNVQQ